MTNEHAHNRLKENRRKLEAEEDKIESLRSDLEKAKKSKADGGGGDSTASKYELLKKREKEMAEFGEKFPATREKAVRQLKESEREIVLLLEHVAKDVVSLGGVGSIGEAGPTCSK